MRNYVRRSVVEVSNQRRRGMQKAGALQHPTPLFQASLFPKRNAHGARIQQVWSGGDCARHTCDLTPWLHTQAETLGQDEFVGDSMAMHLPMNLHANTRAGRGGARAMLPDAKKSRK